MKVVLSWLNELAPVGSDVDAISEVMNDLGLAVDGIEASGTPVEGVIVAKVLHLRPHPNADRMQLVDVDTGDGQPLQICCGAFNMKVGDLVPLATIGTVMPGGWTISRAKKRGEWSNGMLCSARELELSDDHGGIMILPPQLPIGAPFFEAAGITSDVVFDLDLTRNRPDAWCHLGVARDLAARLGLPLAVPGEQPVEPSGAEKVAGVAIVDGDLCGRFTSTVLTGVRVQPSAPWMAERLTRAGMRPINNVVDVSNYVMLELGQPNHPYDLHKLPGQAFRIRRAKPGETLVTLDDVERAFTANDLLICDGLDQPVGIAGIMGGASAEIDDATTEVALEMAWFEPLSIAGTASRLGMRTEASARFERGVDPYIIDRAIARFVELLRETCPDVAVAPGAVDARGELPAVREVLVRTARVNKVLGTSLSDAEVADLLEPSGFLVARDTAVQQVTIPSWRPDCEGEIDVIEEVARHYGYSRIGKSVPTSAHPGSLSPYQRERRLVRDVLVGLGCFEAMPDPLLGPGDHQRAGLPEATVVITNPMAAEQSHLRASLRPGLLRSIAYNASHRNLGVRLFEVGHVFLPVTDATAPLPDEREHIGVALAGRDALAAVEVWRELEAALGVEGIRIEAAETAGLHPTRTARLVAATNHTLGWVGEIDPAVLEEHGIAERVAWLEVDSALLFAQPHNGHAYRRVSRYPSSDIDLAFVVADDVPAAALEDALRKGAGELLDDLALFDVYRGASLGEGRRSLAYRLRLQAADRTLTDADVAATRQACIDTAATIGAVLRG